MVWRPETAGPPFTEKIIKIFKVDPRGRQIDGLLLQGNRSIVKSRGSVIYRTTKYDKLKFKIEPRTGVLVICLSCYVHIIITRSNGVAAAGQAYPPIILI